MIFTLFYRCRAIGGDGDLSSSHPSFECRSVQKSPCLHLQTQACFLIFVPVYGNENAVQWEVHLFCCNSYDSLWNLHDKLHSALLKRKWLQIYTFAVTFTQNVFSSWNYSKPRKFSPVIMSSTCKGFCELGSSCGVKQAGKLHWKRVVGSSKIPFVQDKSRMML